MESSGASVELNDYLLILKRRWRSALGVWLAVMLMTLVLTFLKKPIYSAQGTLKFTRTNPASSLTGVGKETSSLETVSQDKGSPLTTEAEVFRSVPIVQKTIKKLNLRNPKGELLKYTEFVKLLTVAEVRGADVLNVSYKDTNPQQAANIINTLISIYLENNIISHRVQAAAALRFIKEQLPKAEASVSREEDALRRFKDENQVIAIKEEISATVTLMKDLQQQIVTLQAQMVGINTQINLLKNKLGLDSQQALVVASLSQSPGVQEVLKELQQVETQLTLERDQFQDTHPRILTLKNNLASLKTLLNQRINKALGSQKGVQNANLQMGLLQQDLTKELLLLEGQRQGLASQLATLLVSKTAYSRRASELPRLEQIQRELERKLEGSQFTYSQLLQKFGEIQVAENQNVGNASILSPALIPDQPASSRMISYLGGFLLGILAAGATAYILEVRDKSVKTVEQAKELFGLPLLGVIPALGKAKPVFSRGGDLLEQPVPEVVVQSTPASTIGAAYRMLQANLKFLSSDKAIKVIAVTSSISKEGKSTVSANLAAAIAQSGRRVLLIDADLHRPLQHKIWDLVNEVGLSNMLAEQLEASQAIRSVHLLTNLDVLTAGVLPPNSLALLDSQRMASLIEDFSLQYDFVIIDTPPLTLAAEALILGKMADGLLLVIRPGLVEIGSVAFAKGMLQQSGQRVLGFVANGVVAENEPHSYYYFADESYSGSQPTPNPTHPRHPPLTTHP